MSERFTNADINADVRVHFKRADGSDVFVPGRLSALRYGATVLVLVLEHELAGARDWAVIEAPIEDVERAPPRDNLFAPGLVLASRWKPECAG